MTRGRNSGWILGIILVASAIARMAMCAGGGQYFFGDETRYDRGMQLYLGIASGDLHGVRATVALPDHALFPWVGALATAAQHVLAQATPFGDWARHPEYAGFTVRLGACFLSLFSALNIFLVHRLSRALGADREEALWAALAMAVSNTAFYYARHLLPYDCALSAALAAMVAGAGNPGAGRAAASGLLAGCAYHLYNGYWFLAPVVLLVFAAGSRGHPRRSRLACIWGAGFFLGFGAPLLAGSLAAGGQYWRTLAAFSGTVTQGLFAEGWSLPWAYLWASEGCAGAALAACVALALIRSRRPLESRVRIILAALGAAYGLIVTASVLMERFVVYGRTVKPFVPLLCILAGWALRNLIGGRAWLKRAAAAALLASGIIHFAPHLSRVFPRDVEIAVLRDLGNPKHSLSVSGSVYVPLSLPVARADLVLVNAQMLFPVRDYIGYPPGATLLRIEHPLTYPPYQFEGYTPRQRDLLRTEDISIRLIRLRDPGLTPDDLPLPLRFQNRERPTGR
jgi:hypothetical protein